jgi:catechol 2,3-dioxygenase-like lactoylglutathione lyase family enzyme
MTIKRMDNIGIAVEDLDSSIQFFIALGLELEGRMPIEGEWAGKVTGIRDQKVEIAMLCTPDKQSRIELAKFHAPNTELDHRNSPVNSLGYTRVMFAVEDLESTLKNIKALGAKIVDKVVTYNNIYKLCYVRSPEGILIGLAQQLVEQSTRKEPLS